MRITKILILTILSALFTGCTDDTNEQSNKNERHDIILARGGDEIVDATNRLAFRLYNEVADGKSNVVISPLSIYQYLSMVANGADGETRKEIEALIGAEDMSIDDINNINHDLMSKLKVVDNKTQVVLANSIWKSKDINITKSYLSVLDKLYSAETYDLDILSSDAARGAINKWCEERTFGVVSNFLENNLDGYAKYVLYNATYFKSEWEEPFKAIPNRDFNNADGTSSLVNFMIGQLTCRYFENEKLSYVEIPYGNGAFVFTIALPKDNEKFTAEIMDDIKPIYEIMNISMPKFAVDYKGSMSDVLKRMGMNTAFSYEADFSKASAYSQPLPEIMHAASIEVDEKGTVVATVSGSGWVSAPMPRHLNIDRPFTFFIKETSTSTILFIGEINRL